MPRVKLFVAMPGYRGGCHNVDALLHGLAQPTYDIDFRYRTSSLLTQNFNALWAEALTARRRGEVTHFLMIHTDVQPKVPDWIERMLGEMAATQADILSAIIPIKDDRGLTSTAFDTSRWGPRRLTMWEAFQRPVTWTAPTLLVNTGLLLVDFREEWVESICFHIDDAIEEVEGTFVARCAPEDYNFSRQARALGRSIYATRCVPVLHWGDAPFPNDRPWGTVKAEA